MAASDIQEMVFEQNLGQSGRIRIKWCRREHHQPILREADKRIKNRGYEELSERTPKSRGDNAVWPPGDFTEAIVRT